MDTYGLFIVIPVHQITNVVIQFRSEYWLVTFYL